MKMVGRLFAVVVAVVMLLTTFSSCAVTPSGEDASYAFYVKDEQLVMMETNTKKVYPVTQHFRNESGLFEVGMVRLDESSTRMFYLDYESDAQDAEEYLFMRDLTNLKADTIKLDSTSGLFDISKDGKMLLYLKKNAESGYSLYRHDLEKSTLIVEGLTGFGFTKNEDLPYYTLGEDQTDYFTGEEEKKTYHLVSDAAIAMTLEEFEAKTGGARPYVYAFEGVNLQHLCLSYEQEVIDAEIPWTGAGSEAYYYDRLLYFTQTDDREYYKIKQYIKGEEPQLIDRVATGTFPAVGYTSDGLPIYLQNYDTETKTGELMLYKNGESILLDESAGRPLRLDRVVNLVYSFQKRLNWTK